MRASLVLEKEAMERGFEERLAGLRGELEMLRRQLEEGRRERMVLEEGMEERIREEVGRRGDVLAEAQRLEFVEKEEATKLEMVRVLARESQYEERLSEMRASLVEAKEERDEWRGEKEKLEERVMHFLSGLGGNGSSSSKGQLGESLVANAFSHLSRMGTLENTSKNQNDGYADYLWKKEFEGGTPGLRCGVEAKYVADRLHSKNDVAKFEKFVSDGVMQKRINCAILISERCRIQNREQIDVEVEHGILVVRASRGEEDNLSIDSLIKLTFLTVAEIWPHLGLHRHEEEGTVVRNVACFLRDLMSRLGGIDGQIEFLDKTGLKMIRQAAELGQLRSGIMKEIQTLQMQHRQLGGEAASSEGIDAAGILVNAIGAYREARKRYPKMEQLETLGVKEDVVQLCRRDPDLFEGALATVKAKKRGKKECRGEGQL